MCAYVSVIVPNFNHAPYLKLRIDSILHQTFDDFELIILDDNSTDNSKFYIEQYRSHKKVSHIVYNESNSGNTFLQWDKGIKLASGKFVWIAESDDWCEPSFLEALLAGIEENQDCVISYCQSSVVYGEYIKWQSHHTQLSEIVDGKVYIKKSLSIRPSIFNASMAIWRRDAYNSISKEFISYRYCGDWFFWAQLAQLGSVHISGKVLNYFRKHNGDVTTGAKQSGVEILEGMRLVTYLYNNSLIGNEEFILAYKRHFKLFLSNKDKIANKSVILKIDEMFNNTSIKKIQKLKIFISAIWSKIRSKEVY